MVGVKWSLDSVVCDSWGNSQRNTRVALKVSTGDAPRFTRQGFHPRVALRVALTIAPRVAARVAIRVKIHPENGTEIRPESRFHFH